MSKKQKKIKLPQKRTINLAANLIKKTNWLLAFPLIVLIILGACAFSKVFVVDQMVELSNKRSQIADKKNQIKQLEETILEISDISDDYDHYTFAGLTDVELQYMNRMDVVRVIEKTILPYAKVQEYSVRSSEVSVKVTAATLTDVKDIVARLEEEALVDYCVMKEAAYSVEMPTMSSEEEFVEEDYAPIETVLADIVIYLNTEVGGVQ